MENVVMSDEEFAKKLLSHPCPECGDVGFLHPQLISITSTYKGETIKAEGEGTACDSCNHTFMSDELVELVANQTHRIDKQQSPTQYFLVEPKSGNLTAYPLQ